MEFFTHHYILTFFASSLIVGLGGSLASISLNRNIERKKLRLFLEISVYAVLIGLGVFGQTLSWRGLDRENEKERLVHTILAELN